MFYLSSLKKVLIARNIGVKSDYKRSSIGAQRKGGTKLSQITP